MVGVTSFHDGWNVSELMKYAVPVLRHRGDDGWAAIFSKGNGLTTFQVKEGNNALSGEAGLLCLSTNSDSRGVVRCGDADVAYCLEGLVIRPEDVCRLIDNEVKALSYTSLIALTSNGELIAHRPITGLRNLVLGAYGFDLAMITNESSAIGALGGDVRTFIRPGSTIRVSRLNLSIIEGLNNSRGGRLCAVEFIYLSRPDSEIDGYSVYEFRRVLASKLAGRLMDRMSDFDVVIGMPETGVIYGIKVAEALRKPFEYALMNIERRRSALRKDLIDKLSSIHLKLSPVTSAVRGGKRVLLIDDSLLTGLSIKEASQVLRHRAGVSEIHVAIASPRIVRSCPYGVDMPPNNQLLTNTFNDEDAQRVLEVDSLTWLSLEDLYEAADEVGIGRDYICTYCMGGGRGLDI
ncbi:phosphoribosyltransferase family protein [Vulcanisaeta distributa]|uniref:phosphoribosyltransferase family protein n=1 Tax=Vulcanisaeta distributa TaxID=164451 RepID=UPI000AEAEB9A|nr:phosphoribosyltransferase family protein [Vulcanisaeta distributa]